MPVTKKAEFTNIIDPDEEAHYEPPHQDLQCFLLSLSILNIIQLEKTIIKLFADVNFVVCFLALKELRDKWQLRVKKLAVFITVLKITYPGSQIGIVKSIGNAFTSQ